MARIAGFRGEIDPVKTAAVTLEELFQAKQMTLGLGGECFRRAVTLLPTGDGSVFAIARIQLRISPGGSVPNSSRNRPEEPPSSAMVTMAVKLLVYCFKPRIKTDKPEPPPMTTSFGPRFS